MTDFSSWGPRPVHLDTGRAARADAIAWVRRSLFARMRGNPYRSDLAVAIMYATEHVAGDAPPAKRPKQAAAHAKLSGLRVDQLFELATVARKTTEAATEAATGAPAEWAERARSMLSDMWLHAKTREAAR